MMNRNNWVEYLRNIPNWIKSTIGFITILVTFTLLILNNRYLGITITIGVLFVACFIFSLYIAFKKQYVRSRTPGRGSYQYSELRIFGFGGMLATAIIAIGLLRSEPSKSFVISAFIGTPTPVPAHILIPTLLDYSNEIATVSPEWEAIIDSQETQCKESRYDMVCWIILGQYYSSADQYQKGLNAYTIARDINPRIADPYYSIGNLYYELAMIDLIKKGRFTLDEENLIVNVNPDHESATLFGEVLKKYNQAYEHELLEDLNPEKKVRVTSLTIINYRQEQIGEFLNGNPTIILHRLEHLKAFSWLLNAYPEDEYLQEKVLQFGLNLFEYMDAHPEEFPGVIIP